VISLHAPLTPDTRNLIGAKELRKMKRTAILINTSRGGLVDEQALVEALTRADRRRRFRRAHQGAAEGRQSAARSEAAEFHSHAARRLGQRRCDAVSRRSADRQHRGVRRRQSRSTWSPDA
jgi:hypothetical protein